MRKYDFISALAKETAAEVVKNREEWMKYLTTAARLYKYPFREQLLIYAQRPDATACASIELWNERMHCWVNKGAKGIALLEDFGAQGVNMGININKSAGAGIPEHLHIHLIPRFMGDTNFFTTISECRTFGVDFKATFQKVKSLSQKHF